MTRWYIAAAAAGLAAAVALRRRRAHATHQLAVSCDGGLGLPTLEEFSGGAEGSQRLPMLVVLHSRGATPAGASAFDKVLQTPARVLSPRGPLSLGGGYAWFLDALGAKDQEHLAAEIRQSGELLANFLRTAQSCRPTLGKPVVTGSSQGGAMALYLASWHPDLIAGAVAVNAWLPRQLWRSSMARTVVLNGDEDKSVDPRLTQEYVLEMQRLGAPVSFEMHESGHGISQDLGRAWKDAVIEMMP